IRMLPIKVLDRVPDGLGGSLQLPCDAAADLRQVAGDQGPKAPGAPANFPLLRFRELAELAALLHPLLMGCQEGIRQRRQKTHLTPPVVQDRQTDQTALSPAVDGLGRDVELAAEFLQ